MMIAELPRQRGVLPPEGDLPGARGGGALPAAAAAGVLLNDGRGARPELDYFVDGGGQPQPAAAPSTIPKRPENGFIPDPAELAALVTPRTRATWS